MNTASREALKIAPLSVARAAMVLALGLGAWGCEDDPQIARAEFRRPTGLAFIQRPISLACPTGALVDDVSAFTPTQRGLIGAMETETFAEVSDAGIRQGMLLVADAEAEGVRVQLYQQDVQASGFNGVPIETLISNRVEIVPGPAVFFPLVLSAPGFPTKVAAAKDSVRMELDCTYVAFAAGVTDAVDDDGNLVFDDDGNRVQVATTATLTDGVQPDRIIFNDQNEPVAYTIPLRRTVSRAARSFVLSGQGGEGGTTAAVYAIDTRPRELFARANAFDGFALERLDLGRFRHTAGPWTTNDIQTVAYRGCEAPLMADQRLESPCDNQGTDIIALLQDPIADDDGRLVFVRLDRQRASDPNDPSQPMPPGDDDFVSVRLPGPAHPQSMVVLEDRILVSDAGGTDIFDVPYTITGTVVPTINVGTVRRLNAGGPTRQVIDGGDMGVFAVRIDLPRLVVFERDGDRLVRSTDRLSSPFAYAPDPGNAANLGVLDLRDSPITTAEVGDLRLLVQPFGREGILNALNTEDFFGGTRAPVLNIVQADSGVTFIVGSPPRVAVLRDDQVFAVRRLDDETGDETPEDRLELIGCEGPPLTDASEDPDGPVPACFPTNPVLLQCDDRVRLRQTTGTITYRATHRGAVFEAFAGTLNEDVVTGDDGTVAFTVEDIDTRISDTATSAIRLQDSVLLQLSLSSNTDTDCEDLADVVVEGQVQDLGDDFVTVTSTTPLSTGCDVAFRRLEVFPNGEEGVLARYVGATIDEVLQRVPIGTPWMTFEGTTLAGEPLDIEFSVDGSAFNEGRGEARSEGRICTAPIDCLDGFACEPDTPDESLGAEPRTCFNRCRRLTSCDPATDASCPVDRRIARAGIEITVSGSPLVLTRLVGSLTGGTAATPLALPADVVFAPMLSGWLISTPGTRAVVELVPTAFGINLRVVR